MEKLGLLASARMMLHPVPIVVDPSLRIPLDSNLVLRCLAHAGANEGPSSTPRLIILASSVRASLEKTVQLEALPGISIHFFQEDEARSTFSLSHALSEIRRKHDIHSIMVEGGASVIQHLIHEEAGCVSQVVLTMAPEFYGTGVGMGGIAKTNPSDASTVPISLSPLRTPPAVLGKDLVLMGGLKG
jgi:riboflavin biosynthesis pyrimidine reductase